MKSLLTPRKALAVLLMGLGASGHAMTVGPLQGATVVGRPLDLTAPVRLEAGGAEANCLRAEVFYGDTPLAAEAVRLSVQGDGTQVRIAAAKPVNEPVVTVVMHGGCRQEAIRRYVVLADPPSAVAAATVAAPQVLGAAAGAPPVRVAERAPERAAARAPASKKARAAHHGPRLTLEATSIPAANPALLRVSTQMRTQPATDATQRAAAALLWQVLNVQPRDLLRMGDRMNALEREIASLREASLKQRELLAGLDDPRPSASGLVASWPLAGALLALAALMAGVLGWRGLQERKAAGRWREAALSDSTFGDHDSQDEPTPPVRVERAPSPEALAVAVSPVEIPPPQAHDFTPAPAQPSARLAVLADLLQECEFLVSLNDVQRAADVLRAHVERTRDASALALLELRELCAQVADDEGIEFAEGEYGRRFGEAAPARNAGSGLDQCDIASARIAAVWAQPQAPAVIEELLFGGPALLGGTPGVQAWRDLLMLHRMAQEEAAAADDEHVAAPDGVEMTIERLHAVDFQPERNRFAVDLALQTVNLSRHRVLEGGGWAAPAAAKAPALPEPELALAPLPDFEPSRPADAEPKRTYEDFFEAVGAAEGRALHVR